MDYTRQLKNSAQLNVWDTALLEELHPRKDFDASSANLPAPMQMLTHIIDADVTGLLRIIGQPLYTMPSELYRWVKMDTHYNASQFDELRMHSEYVTTCYDSIVRGKVTLPEMLKGAVIFLNQNFDLDKEQLHQIQDTAYLFSMIGVMAGAHNVEDTLETLSGMWEL